MGLYDTIEGNQIKCFPWLSYHTNPIAAGLTLEQHSGSMREYKFGDILPYKSYHYNYTPNFTIIDVNPEEDAFAFVLFIVRDTKLKSIICISQHKQEDYEKDKQIRLAINTEKQFDNDYPVISRTGQILNIQSLRDCHEYCRQEKQYRKNIAATVRTKNYRMRDRISRNFCDRWYNTEFEAEKYLGKWLFAANRLLLDAVIDKDKYEQNFPKFCKDFRKEFPIIDENMLKSYHKWQDSTAEEQRNISHMLSLIENTAKG